ncbi:DUF896 domain-containing protein [Paenibacillus sp. N1-5-1-14]|uniref:DUF896 domain-containing protein n=1 Tax=Paenibacillus radicibacter TaxID=2972488 RepID=UPI00215923F6|nr:DUF896 domain-containing protein [Paenibacillus radicibacter]MCR8641595.1 DUF896 domain-containing protein [Paenibacillus radicibacter]
MEDTIKRINELARKHKAQGLSEEETAERDVLRKKYIQSVTGNLESHLKTITVVDEHGNELKRKKGK